MQDERLPTETEVAVITKHELDVLSNYPATGSPVVSFYLSIDRHERDEKTPFTEVKNLLKTGQELISRWPAEQRVPLALYLTRIEETTEEERGGRSRGLVIFAGEGLWQVHRLPIQPGNHIVIDRTPYVKPLILLFQRSPRYCTLLVDKERARLFLIQMGEIQDYSLVLDEVPKHHEQGGWAQARLQRRHEDYVMHHLKRSAELTLEFFQREGFDYLLVGGTDEMTSAFYERLHTYLQERMVGSFVIATNASASDVLEQTLRVMEAVEARLAEQLTARLKEEVGQGKLGIAGLSASIRALNAHKVAELIVEEGYQTTGGRCGDCGSLSIRSTGKCRYCQGKIERVVNLVDEAVEKAFAQGAQVHFVAPNQTLWDMGRMGSLLRYA
jgi:peptide subunit release factor 1 (eRF1)